MAIGNQFDNKIVFVLRGEHVQGGSRCIVDFPASCSNERRLAPIGAISFPDSSPKDTKDKKTD